MEDQLAYYQKKLAYEMDSADLFESMQKNEKTIVIDARKTFAYDREHIIHALNIPHREMNRQTTKDLNRDFLYVVYCDGIGCNASTKGALNMVKLGFKVKELIGGLEWWKFDDYPTEGGKQDDTSDVSDMRCSC